MRWVIRWLLSTVAVGLVVAVLYGMVGEFFIEWARERGWYAHPSERLNATMDAFGLFVTQTWFLCTAAFFAGLALGLWADSLLRHHGIPSGDDGTVAGSESQDRRGLIARWRTMLAETAVAVRQHGVDIRTVLLGSPEYLSLEPHLEIRFRYLVRTGTTSHGHVAYAPAEGEEGLSYEDRVLFHLSNEVRRIERKWAAAGG